MFKLTKSNVWQVASIIICFVYCISYCGCTAAAQGTVTGTVNIEDPSGAGGTVPAYITHNFLYVWAFVGSVKESSGLTTYVLTVILYNDIANDSVVAQGALNQSTWTNGSYNLVGDYFLVHISNIADIYALNGATVNIGANVAGAIATVKFSATLGSEMAGAEIPYSETASAGDITFNKLTISDGPVINYVSAYVYAEFGSADWVEADFSASF